MGGYIKPHRKPNRLNKWNYNNFGFYFVTICTKDRQEYFGNVYNGMVELNEIGKIVCKCWQQIENHFTDVSVDEFVIMPNHVHGIILLTNVVGNRHACSLQDNRQYQLLPTATGSFKSSATRIINNFQSKFQFQWQKSYYDHVIHTEGELQRIRNYIRTNPLNWIQDRNNPINYAKNIKNKGYPPFE